MTTTSCRIWVTIFLGFAYFELMPGAYQRWELLVTISLYRESYSYWTNRDDPSHDCKKQ